MSNATHDGDEKPTGTTTTKRRKKGIKLKINTDRHRMQRARGSTWSLQHTIFMYVANKQLFRVWISNFFLLTSSHLLFSSLLLLYSRSECRTFFLLVVQARASLNSFSNCCNRTNQNHDRRKKTLAFYASCVYLSRYVLSAQEKKSHRADRCFAEWAKNKRTHSDIQKQIYTLRTNIKRIDCLADSFNESNEIFLFTKR